MYGSDHEITEKFVFSVNAKEPLLYSVFKLLLNVVYAFLSKKLFLFCSLDLYSFLLASSGTANESSLTVLCWTHLFFLDVVERNVPFLHLLTLPSMILRSYSLALTFGEHLRVQGLSKNRNWSFLYMWVFFSNICCFPFR